MMPSGGQVLSQSLPAQEPREMSSYRLHLPWTWSRGGKIVCCEYGQRWGFSLQPHGRVCLTPVLGAAQPQSHIDQPPGWGF